MKSIDYYGVAYRFNTESNWSLCSMTFDEILKANIMINEMVELINREGLSPREFKIVIITFIE